MGDRTRTNFGDVAMEEVFVDLPNVSGGMDAYSVRAQPTILETFDPMYGSFRTSPRSLAVIFRGNADDPVSDTHRVRNAYVSTFDSLWSTGYKLRAKTVKGGAESCSPLLPGHN
jgi:hypothetical protein